MIRSPNCIKPLNIFNSIVKIVLGIVPTNVIIIIIILFDINLASSKFRLKLHPIKLRDTKGVKCSSNKT